MNNRRSATLGCKDIGIKKLEFVAKTQLIFKNVASNYKSYK